MVARHNHTKGDAMTSTDAPKPTLQFDAAEPATASATSACAACNRALTDSYHTVNAKLLCEACRRRLESAWTSGAGAANFGRAFIFGLGAAAVGAGIYYAVLALTGYEIGLIAILVGFIVGRAVAVGSGGRGGLRYQVTAVALTYCSIVATYVPLIAKGGASEAGPLALFLMALVLPVMEPFLSAGNGIIGLLIIGFALFEAGRQTRGVKMVFAGPFQVKSARSPSA
jgi:hypothetical protein